MPPVPTSCLLCGSPLKNDICPSCGWNPAAPNPGKTEAQILEEKRRAELREMLTGSPAPAAAPSTPVPVQQSAPVSTPASDADPDATLKGYLLGLGYSADAIPAILANNREGIQASFEKAFQMQRSAPAAAPVLPKVSAPPVGTGWNG